MKKTNDIFDDILNQGPSPSTAFIILDKMRREGRSKEVIQNCLRALDYFPDDLRLRSLLAEACLAVGFFGRAEKELEKVVLEMGRSAPALKRLGELYASQNRPEEAVGVLKKYLAHYPTDEEASALLSSMAVSQREPASEPYELFEEPSLIQVGAGLADLATPTLAEIYFRQGQRDEAIATYEQVLMKNPDDTRSMERLAELKAMDRMKREAKTQDAPAPKKRKEKMIAILENWLSKLQESTHG